MGGYPLGSKRSAKYCELQRREFSAGGIRGGFEEGWSLYQCLWGRRTRRSIASPPLGLQPLTRHPQGGRVLVRVRASGVGAWDTVSLLVTELQEQLV